MERMALAFFYASPYAKYGVDEEKIRGLAHDVATGDKTEKIGILLQTEGHTVGALGAIAIETIFNRSKTTIDLMWWVDPGHRNARNARMMLDAYEYWADNVVHAQQKQLVSLDELTGRLYERRGFKKMEYAYSKGIV